MDVDDAPVRRLANYHTHTWRCGHAGGTEEDFVRTALEQGFAVLGFADHTPWPYGSGFVAHMRMRLDQLEDYLATARSLAERYADRLLIPVGLECEAFPEYMGWLSDMKAQSLDYAILGNHYYITDDPSRAGIHPDCGLYFGRCSKAAHLLEYAEQLTRGMATGLFDYVAHPDIFLCAWPRFDAHCAAVSRDICAAAKALDVPLEYNLLGRLNQLQYGTEQWLGYPCRDFWEIAAEAGCRAIIGFDAHQSWQLTRIDLYDEARSTLKELGIETLDHLPGAGLFPAKPS